MPTQETHALSSVFVGDEWQCGLRSSSCGITSAAVFLCPFARSCPLFFFSWRSGGGGVDNPR